MDVLVVLTTFVSSIFVLPAALSSRYQLQKVMVVEDLPRPCDNTNYSIKVDGFNAKRNGSFTILNGSIIVDRDLRNPVAIHIRIEKCSDKGNPDTCEYFTTWKWDDICTTLSIIPFMNDWYNAHSPPASCPYKKNHYLVNLRMRSDTYIPFLGNGRDLWKFQVEVIEAREDQLSACVGFSFRFANTRISRQMDLNIGSSVDCELK